jgi:DNA-binding LacI/PurR family transcriptional regulator
MVSPHTIRCLAAEAAVCIPTAAKFVHGLPVRSTCRARLEEAARKLNLVPASAAASPPDAA